MRTPSRRAAPLLPILTALALTGCAASSRHDALPRTALVEHELARAPLPASLAVPAGNQHALSLRARGVQVYACDRGATGSYAWTFVEPDAQLFDQAGCAAGDHYAGPTWEAEDGSTVVATKVADAVVDERAIPWLLLKATSTAPRGRMADVTYVQRVETHGGLAPRESCDAAHAGETREVPYSARYAFYRAPR